MVNFQNKKITRLKIILKNSLLFLCVLFLAWPQLLLAQSMSSSNYVIQTDIINMAGGQSSSATYESASKVGKLELDLVVTGVPDDTGGDEVSGDSGSSGGGTISQTIQTVIDQVPQNVTNFTATASSNSIRLNWRNPSTANFDRVVIVRSQTFFPTSPNDGELIYEGRGTGYTDQSVAVGLRYFYTAFSFYDDDHSSGSVASAIILKPGQLPPLPVIDLPLIPTVIPEFEALSLLDFDFIQATGQAPKEGGLVAIDGDKPLLISLDYNKVPEVLKTIAITLYDPEDRNQSFSFLLRANGDKSAYQAHIGALGRSGTYDLEITVLDYENKGIKRIEAALVASASSIFSKIFPGPPLDFKLIIPIMLALILVGYLVRRFYRYQDVRRRRKREPITFSQNHHV